MRYLWLPEDKIIFESTNFELNLDSYEKISKTNKY